MMSLSKSRSYTATYLALFETSFFFCLFSLSFNTVFLYTYHLYENALTGQLNCVQNLLLCVK